MIDLCGRAALVTGGAGTLGRALAVVLLERGMRVSLADLDASRLEAAVARLGAPPGLSWLTLDVADPERWRHAADQAERQLGPISLLCNNAGLAAARRPLTEVTPAQWSRMVDVSLTGVFLGARELAPRMIAGGGGHILNIASMGGLLAERRHGEYCAAKAGVISLSETLRAELAPHGVGLSVLCAGAIGHPVGHMAGEAEPAAAPGRMDPVAGVRRAIDAMCEGQFYLFTHADTAGRVARRFDDILTGLAQAAAPPMRAATNP